MEAVADDRFAFSQQRMAAARRAMEGLLANSLDPYTGTFSTAANDLVQLGDDGDPRYADALTRYATSQGAVVVDLSRGGAPISAEGVVLEAANPVETIVLMAAIPNSALLGPAGASANMYEAMAEVLRVMLSVAISAAKHDCQNDETAQLVIRSLSFATQMDFEHARVVSLARIRGAVVCSNEPKASYLLGSIKGQPRPFQIAYELPLVEMVYGDNRIRWMDRRAPDCTSLVLLTGGAA